MLHLLVVTWCSLAAGAPSAEGKAEAASEAQPGHRIERAPRGEVSAADLIAARSKEARERGLRLYVMTTADWCRPCVAIKKHDGDPRMGEAYAGVHLLRFDFDEWPEDQLKAAGIATDSLPWFYEVGPDGRLTGRAISSSAWGEDIPENMVPVLKRFFHPEAP